MGLNDLKNSSEIKEIFDHIQDILNEKNESNIKNEQSESVENSQESDIVTKKIISTSKSSTHDSMDSNEHNTLKKSDSLKVQNNPNHKLNMPLKKQEVDLASLSKELDTINKRISQASVMTVEHEQFKENKLLNDAEEPLIFSGIEDLNNKTCDLCNDDIDLEKNLSGLVVGGEFFACESCCKHSSNEELTNWTKSKMKSSSDFQPIGLWVTREKNKKHRW